MKSLGTVKYSLKVVGKWIFVYTYKIALSLSIESLSLICSCYEEEKVFAFFDTLFHDVSYFNPRVKKGLCLGSYTFV